MDDWLQRAQAPWPDTDEGMEVTESSERAGPFVGGRLQTCVGII
jgi:hypothetical protein